MRILKTRYFKRWAEHEGLTDTQLKAAVAELKQGLNDGRLGGCVYKKRIGIRGSGKRGSLRTIIAYKSSDRSFFVYGYAKNFRETITTKEKEGFQQLAKDLFLLDEKALSKLIQTKELIEVV